MDSYSKKYSLRNSSPPIPDCIQGHREHLFGSWYKYLIEDGNKVFYYNTKTYERTWSSPKRRVVDVCYWSLSFYDNLTFIILNILFLK